MYKIMILLPKNDSEHITKVSCLGYGTNHYTNRGLRVNALLSLALEHLGIELQLLALKDVTITPTRLAWP